jgi:uracil-DNA glycosylase family 4
MSDRQSAFLQEMGLLPRWTLRDSVRVAAAISTPAALPLQQEDAVAACLADPVAVTILATSPVPVTPVAVMNWNQLAQSVASCSLCTLCAGRSNTVFGAGDINATWLFIGAAPDAADEAEGMPLAGPGGSLFNNMLGSMGLQPDQNVYVTNLLKCRPAQTSALTAELAACRPYLERQIALLAPTIIVALGADVAAALLGDTATELSGLRGTLHRYAGLPLIVTYAPEELLRSPEAKAGAWRDLCLAQNTDAASA